MLYAYRRRPDFGTFQIFQVGRGDVVALTERLEHAEMIVHALNKIEQKFEHADHQDNPHTQEN